MNRIFFTSTLAFAAVMPFALQGAEDDESPNRFSFGPRFGLNFKGNFHDNAAYFNGVNPGPGAGGANHTYNDGYVLLDSSGDAGGLTGNWGYQNASQAAGGGIQYHAIQSAGSAATSNDPQYGGELVFQRVLGSPLPSVSWGLETGFGVTQIGLRANQSGPAAVTTDTYPLNGVLPPGAGYNGTFSGPGALLGDTPVRTTTSAIISSQDKLQGQLFSLRLGPFAEWHFLPRLSLAGSMGITLAPTTLRYDFSETAILATGASFSTSGQESRTRLLYGPFAGAMLRYDLDKNWGVNLGAQFQNLTDLNLSAGGRTARFDPGTTVYLSTGLTWKF